MRKLFNFSAGPAVLPEAVLTQAAAEMSDWHGTGMSVMEMSHRGKDYMGIQAQAEADLRELLDIPAEYKVLFLAGGATLQFAALLLNLLPEGGSADYIDTGATGATGADGKNAEAEVKDNGDGTHTVTIKDGNGNTTTTIVKDGATGAKGEDT